jgi:hypothetical protein
MATQHLIRLLIEAVRRVADKNWLEILNGGISLSPIGVGKHRVVKIGG